MPETSRTIIVQNRNDSLKITYHEDKGEFELEFDPELDEYTGASRKVLIHLILTANTVRQMAEVLPPLDPESVH